MRLNPLYKKSYTRYYSLICNFLVSPSIENFPEEILKEYSNDWKNDILLNNLAYLSTMKHIKATPLNFQVTCSQLESYKTAYEQHYEKFFNTGCRFL